MRLKCQCCDFEQEFKDGEEAFQTGWDAPPHFTGYICCNLCPAVTVVLGAGHKLAHALWAAEGRPKEWSFEKCCTDKDFGDPKAQSQFDGSFDAFKKVMKLQEEDT